MHIELTTVVLSAIVVGIVYYLFGPRRKNYPPGPIQLPFFGNLLTLGETPHLSFARYAKKYGPIFSVRMGQEEALVVHGPKLIREALNEPGFQGRPKNEAMELFLTGGRDAMGMAEGDSWAEQRRFAVRHLANFGFGRQSMESLIMEDVNELIEWIASQKEKPLELRRRVGLALFSSFWAILCGERINHGDAKLTSILDELEVRLGALFGRKGKSLFLYFYPRVAKMFPNWSGWNLLLKSMALRDSTLEKAIAEHKRTLRDGEPRDFIDSFLMEVKATTDPSSSFHPSNSDKRLQAIMVDMFAAAADSTSIHLYWTLLYILNHEDVQTKLGEEVDRVVGGSRQPSLADRNSMPYSEAFLMELTRATSVSSVGFPHAAMEDVHFQGFLIPKGTSVYPSLWATHHDESIWEDPFAFRPERFLSPDGTTVVRHEALLPFSIGKRVCIGEALAKDQLFLFTTSLVQRFQLLPEPGKPKPTLAVKTGHIGLEPNPYLVVMKERP